MIHCGMLCAHVYPSFNLFRHEIITSVGMMMSHLAAICADVGAGLAIKSLGMFVYP